MNLLSRIVDLPRGRVARGTVATTAVMAVRVCALAVQMLLAARLLQPESFAHYVAVGVLAVLLGGLSTFGTQLLVLRDVARGEGIESFAIGLGTWRWLALPLFGIYLLACQSMGLLGGAWLLILGVGVAEFFLQPLLQLIAAVLQGRGAVPLGQGWLVAPLAARALLILGLTLVSPPEPLAWLGGVHLVASLAPVVLMLRFGGVGVPSHRQWRRLLGKEWGAAAGFALLGVTANAQAELDKLLAVRLLPLGAAGLYAAASRVLGAVVLPVMAMLVSAMPRLFGKVEWDRRLVSALATASLAYACLAGGAVWVLAPCVGWLLGPGYAGVEEVLRTLLWALPAQSLRLVALNVLMTKGSPATRVGVEAFGMACLVSVALGMRAAGYGLAAAVVLAEWATMLVAVGVIALQVGRRRWDAR